MTIFKTFLQGIGLILFLHSNTSWAINLTPNDIRDGTIPSHYTDIVFSVGNGNWASDLTLPENAQIGTTISISSQAYFDSNIHGIFGGIPKDIPVIISEGQNYDFTRKAGYWDIGGSNVERWTPVSVGKTLPDTHAGVVFYTLANGNFYRSFTLPKTAPKNALLIVKSTAAYHSRVDELNRLYASTHLIKRGDSYVYRFDEQTKKWLEVSTPTRSLTANTLITREQLPIPTGPVTEYFVYNGNWSRYITLPIQAQDRDRVRIKSRAGWWVQIKPQGIKESTGTLNVRYGDTYEFLYIADSKQWVMTKSPEATFNVNSLASGNITIQVPNTLVNASNGNWKPSLYLSAKAISGDKVTIKTSAAWGFNIVAQDSPSLGNVRINNGEEISFLRVNNQWTRETKTVSILLVYSSETVARIGESAERARLFESYRMTNQALRNSNAHVRLKIAGWLEHTVTGVDDDEVLIFLSVDQIVQNERARLKADAVYYEGTQQGCGLAYINSSAQVYYMYGVGSLDCPTITMRHEFGHNLGLGHCSGGRGGYGHGYQPAATIMCGNATPYYSTPDLYNEYFQPRGVAGQHDSVRAINENATAISEFY